MTLKTLAIKESFIFFGDKEGNMYFFPKNTKKKIYYYYSTIANRYHIIKPTMDVSEFDILVKNLKKHLDQFILKRPLLRNIHIIEQIIVRTDQQGYLF